MKLNMDNKKLIPIVVIVLIFLAGGFGFWYWSQRKVAAPKTTKELFSDLSPAEAKDTLGGQILGKMQNPLEGELPPINPFEKTETNPLKDVYKNPFE